MTEDKAPEWASKAAQAVNSDIVNDTGNDVEIIALALSQAYERGQESMREMAAVVASGNSHAFDFQRALAECRDSEYGHMSARVEVAKAIRALPIEQKGEQ